MPRKILTEDDLERFVLEVVEQRGDATAVDINLGMISRSGDAGFPSAESAAARRRAQHYGYISSGNGHDTDLGGTWQLMPYGESRLREIRTPRHRAVPSRDW